MLVQKLALKVQGGCKMTLPRGERERIFGLLFQLFQPPRFRVRKLRPMEMK